MDSAQLLALIGALRGRTVAVIGDVVADEFVYGRVARVSREAPVLILEYDSTEIVPGGAGNAANNVAALGGRAALVARRRSRRAWPASAGVAAPRRRRSAVSIRRRRRSTPVKTRILAGGIHSAKQQVVRIDRAVGNGVDRDHARRSSGSAGRVARGRCGAGLRLRLRPGDAGARVEDSRRRCDSRAGRFRC